MDATEIADSEILKQTLQCVAANVRLFLSVTLLMCITLVHSYYLQSFMVIKMVWVWVSMAFFFSLVRTVTNQHTQLRRLGALRAGNIDPVNLRLTLIDRDFNESDYEMLLALDESAPPVKPRGSQELVSSLPTIHVTAAWLNEGNAAHEASVRNGCAVCLDGFELGTVVRELPCGHFFHMSCVTEWLLKSARPLCPVCKQDVSDRLTALNGLSPAKDRPEPIKR